MLTKAALIVTTFVATTSFYFQAPSIAKDIEVSNQGPNKVQEYQSSFKGLPVLIRSLKRDQVYTSKMRMLIKEALEFEKSLGGQTKMTKLIRKKIDAKGYELALKYPKEVMTLNKYFKVKR